MWISQNNPTTSSVQVPAHMESGPNTASLLSQSRKFSLPHSISQRKIKTKTMRKDLKWPVEATTSSHTNPNEFLRQFCLQTLLKDALSMRSWEMQETTVVWFSRPSLLTQSSSSIGIRKLKSLENSRRLLLHSMGKNLRMRTRMNPSTLTILIQTMGRPSLIILTPKADDTLIESSRSESRRFNDWSPCRNRWASLNRQLRLECQHMLNQYLLVLAGSSRSSCSSKPCSRVLVVLSRHVKKQGFQVLPAISCGPSK